MLHVPEALNLISRIAQKMGRSAETVRHRAQLRALAQYRPIPGVEVDVLLNFPGEPVNMYQIRQWYGPLEHLAKTHTVAILCYQPSTAELVSQETGLKVVLTPSYSDLSEVEDELKPKVILYPNQNYANYRILGLTSAEHVFICHGESDKIYMASNWVKIFNYFFVAGDASRERLRAHVKNYDVDARTIAIGRPQIDIKHRSPLKECRDRTTVLYSPTWEGGRLTMRYGSVASHGVDIVSSLLSDDRFRVVYRPHPRTGVHEDEFVEADKKIRGLITRANAGEGGPHFIDDTPFGWQLDAADAMITDISAVAYDWLTTAKPLIVTLPQESEAVMPDVGFIPQMPLLSADEAKRTAEMLGSLLNDDEERERLSAWADFYYGDRTPGASLARFVHAVEQVIEERDRAVRVADPVGVQLNGRLKGGTTVRQPSALKSVSRGLKFIGRSFDFAATGIANMAAQSRMDSRLINTSDSAMTLRGAEILVSTMAGPHDINLIIEWLPSLERLNKSHSVALLAGNHRTYEKLRELTTLRVYIGRSASETEEVFTSLSPDLHLQFEQANLNLRELTHRKVRHAYIGEAEDDRWINNRLRAFDAVSVEAHVDSELLFDRLIDFPPQTEIVSPAFGEDAESARAELIAALLPTRQPSGDSNGTPVDPTSGTQPPSSSSRIVRRRLVR